MQDQLDLYRKNQPEIAKIYNGKIIAVKDGVVQGEYPSKVEALRAMQEKQYPQGSFMIIRCTEGDEEYTATFHSRVSFMESGFRVNTDA